MDAFGYGLLWGGLDSIREAMSEQNTVQYDWQEAGFQSELESILSDFYSRHLELDREKKDIYSKYPGKPAAVETLNRLSETNSLSPSEYLTLYREIFNF